MFTCMPPGRILDPLFLVHSLTAVHGGVFLKYSEKTTWGAVCMPLGLTNSPHASSKVCVSKNKASNINFLKMPMQQLSQDDVYVAPPICSKAPKPS